MIKIHKADGRRIVSICDENLIGKIFADEPLQLDVSEFFYKGNRMSEEETLNVARNANSLNIVGEKSIKFALKNELIGKENIVKIKKIPHAIAILR